MARNKPLFLIAAFVFCGSVAAVAQPIQTASAFFDAVSQRYGRVENYTARLTVRSDGGVQRGTLYYRNPNRVRIDFTEPSGQVLVSNGQVLQVHIPSFNVTLRQSLQRRSAQSVATMANEQGLHLMRRNYSIAYLTGPDPVPLDEGSTERVTKLKLDWRNTDEGFRQLVLSISEDLLIRRIVGVTVNYQEVQFDFANVLINQDIPDTRFEYNSPPSANVFNNFLFEPEG